MYKYISGLFFLYVASIPSSYAAYVYHFEGSFTSNYNFTENNYNSGITTGDSISFSVLIDPDRLGEITFDGDIYYQPENVTYSDTSMGGDYVEYIHYERYYAGIVSSSFEYPFYLGTTQQQFNYVENGEYSDSVVHWTRGEITLADLIVISTGPNNCASGSEFMNCDSYQYYVENWSVGDGLTFGYSFDNAFGEAAFSRGDVVLTAITVTPLPASFWLLSTGFVSFILLRKKLKRAV